MKLELFKYKNKALKLRKKGISIVKIEKSLKISRSTLSSWFKNIKLSDKQSAKLLLNKNKSLEKGRKKAIVWHNQQKAKRLKKAEDDAQVTMKNLEINNNSIIELALAMLYLGEGSKKNVETAIGSSDPKILQFFLACLKKIYDFDVKRIRCELSLRADQDHYKIKLFWSRKLKLPLACFKQVSVDKRTIGSKTYSHYKGVCQLRCINVAIQRKLVYLSNNFCDRIIEKYLGS